MTPMAIPSPSISTYTSFLRQLANSLSSILQFRPAGAELKQKPHTHAPSLHQPSAHMFSAKPASKAISLPLSQNSSTGSLPAYSLIRRKTDPSQPEISRPDTPPNASPYLPKLDKSQILYRAASVQDRTKPYFEIPVDFGIGYDLDQCGRSIQIQKSIDSLLKYISFAEHVYDILVSTPDLKDCALGISYEPGEDHRVVNSGLTLLVQSTHENPSGSLMQL
ncbi:hypothetical protein BJ508DRAFT_315934 [Ascobolus immersus RN42]|uniref:Uncharacterized protein n=1 Tax=Ascobolus immersus RN42 TaxID=1160509 RepID=A0A3N4H8K3_ASCIM|nr:hypothetical protein BJ508DRAFT_315934 [Ascobolus immersus RN42]